jgi:asparagine synthetase B (glutamine-hydrolysing)
MGSILAVLSREPVTGRQERLEAMAARSPYRGGLTTLHLRDLSLGIQARTDDSTLCEQPDLVVACHGRVYDPEALTRCPGELGSAECLAQGWRDAGSGCLRRLDGDFAAFVHDRRLGATYAFVSVSMARSLYFTARQDLIVVASEVRQVAAGAGIEQRLDLERVVESLVIGGPVIAPHRTQYQHIDRLMAPELYRLRVGAPELVVEESYWSPPATERIGKAEAKELPGALLHELAIAVDALPPKPAFSLSAGYDSGTLWAIANRRGAPARDYYACTLVRTHQAIEEEYSALCRLLEQTATSTSFISIADSAEYRYSEAHARLIDRIPSMPYLHAERLLFERARACGATCHVMGSGAEPMLSTLSTYAADLLRRGQWLLLIRDALRYRGYRSTRVGALTSALRFLRTAIAPPGSAIERLRRPSRGVPRWLHARWRDLAVEAQERYDRLWSREGYGRGYRWVGLAYSVGAGSERHEQHGECHGLELAMPYMHRRIAEFGFRVPARIFNGGRHPKYLLHRCAALALGSEPPWSAYKHRDATSIVGRQLLSGLGDPADWCVATQGIVSEDALHALRVAATSRAPTSVADAYIVCSERHLRLYGPR